MKLLPILCSFAVVSSSFGALREFQLLTDSSVFNHFPGPDGVVGTGDDVVASSHDASDANFISSFSFNQFDFDFNDGSGFSEFGENNGVDGITFLEGTITVDDAATLSTPFFMGLNMNGTQPFPGHSLYTTVSDNIDGGTYNSATGEFTAQFDFTFDRENQPPDPIGDFQTSGISILVEAADFGTYTGNSYVQNTLIPLVQGNANVTALIYIDYNPSPMEFGEVDGVVVGVELVPEPGSAAALAGALALGLVLFMRRRKNQRA